MKLFISYAHEQRPVAEEVNASLAARGFDVFFDRSDLPSGEEYDRRIKHAVELAIRRRSHPNPSGTVLPVMVKAALLRRLDAYLRAVTILYPQGNVAAEVAAAVDELSGTHAERASGDALAAGGRAGRAGEPLQAERIASYKALWQLTRVLPKWPRNTEACYGDLESLSAQFRDWYFGSGGGLFLSRASHTAYSALQNALAAVLAENLSGPLTDEHYDSIRELCSALRTQLARDVGARG
jgi:hypothetical protein